MSRVLIKDVITALEEQFPPRWQEDFDNTGLQFGDPGRICTGALLCVDVTPETVFEAYEKECNLIISHHPLIFHPLKSITGFDRVPRSIVKAIRNDIAVYSCHTSVDNAPFTGVSWEMGRMLGLDNMRPLQSHGPDSIGSGIVGELPEPMTAENFVAKVKVTFGSPVARCSDPNLGPGVVRTVALCGGAGAFLIPDAVEAGADVFIASDCKHNNFIDWLGHILLIDIGHYESENCTKRIFYDVISKKIPNFALSYSEEDNNPIHYL